MLFIIRENQLNRAKKTISDIVMDHIKIKYPNMCEYKRNGLGYLDEEYYDTCSHDYLLYYIRFTKERYRLGDNIEFFIHTDLWNELETWFGELDKDFWKIFLKRHYGYDPVNVYQHNY